MKIRNVGATGLAALLSLCSLSLSGCDVSDRTAYYKGSTVVATENPIPFQQNEFPMAASSDGNRIATVAPDPDHPGDEGKVTVWDVDSMKPLGSLTVAGADGTPIFSRDGKIFYIGTKEGYMGWNYATGEQTKIADKGPQANPVPPPWGFSGWNADRSIAILYPKLETDPGSTKGVTLPGQVVLPGGKAFPIDKSDLAGFDEFGAAWFGSNANWTRVDKSGTATMSKARPGSLAQDQSSVRGSMRLEVTTSKMTHDGGTAYLSCIWLIGDPSLPISKANNPATVLGRTPEKAAVVYAGADIVAWGFVPGKDLVYVVSEFGSYLVPFKFEDKSKARL